MVLRDMKKIVVTGATSMIGIALINKALQTDNVERIYAVIRPDSVKVNRLMSDPRIQIVSCEFSDYENLAALIPEQCDVFYHLAWPRTATYQECYEDIIEKYKNIQVELEAVKAAFKLGCKKFVGAGSQSEYGLVPSGMMGRDTPCNPVRADGVRHLAAGRLAMIVANDLGIDCIWMRIFSVYGKYDRPNSMVNSTIDKLLSGEHCSFTKAEQIWDFLAADDIGEAFYLVGEKSQGSHVYCVGCGKPRTLQSYIKTIRDVVNPNAELGFGELEYPKDAVMNLYADISEIQKDTGWSPQIEFKDGIQEIYQYKIKNREMQN